MGVASREHRHGPLRARRGRRCVRDRRCRRRRQGRHRDVMGVVEFDSRGVTSLDGEWDFFPGDGLAPPPDAPAPETITVPGLWEAQGHLELDGPAWYRRTFDLY